MVNRRRQLCRRCRLVARFSRHQDRQNEIDEEAGAREEQQSDEPDPDQHGVDFEVLSKPPATPTITLFSLFLCRLRFPFIPRPSNPEFRVSDWRGTP